MSIDPQRVQATREHVRTTWRSASISDTEAVLSADDERARAQGLVATGDGLTLDLLADLVWDRRSLDQVVRDLPPALRERLEQL